MTTFNPNPFIGNRTVRPSEDDLATLTRWSRGTMGGIDIGLLWRNAGYFVLVLPLAATVNAATVTGMKVPAHIPFKVLLADAGVESAAGSACTAKVEVDREGAGSWEDLVEAAVDVKTDAGTMKPLAITDGEEDIAVGDELRLSVTATGAGAVLGSVAHLHCMRL